MDLYCDVDGTLIDAIGNIRPYIKELFNAAYKKGYCIYIWSGGGVNYASIQMEKIHNKINLEAPITIIAKDLNLVRNKSFKSVCIDDMQNVCDSFDKFGAHGYHVSYYNINVEDEELKVIMENL